MADEVPGDKPPEALAGFAEPPESFFTINKDRKTYVADWGRIEAIAKGIQERPVEVPLQIHEAIALACWLVKSTNVPQVH